MFFNTPRPSSFRAPPVSQTCLAKDRKEDLMFADAVGLGFDMCLEDASSDCGSRYCSLFMYKAPSIGMQLHFLVDLSL